MYVVGALLNQAVAASNGEADWVMWATTFLTLIVVVAFTAVSLPNVQQRVERWDSAHENDRS